MSETDKPYKKIQKLNSYSLEYKGINVIGLSQVYIYELSLKRLNGFSLLNLLKRFSLDHYAKLILSLSFRKLKPKTNIEYLFVNDIYNKSMISNMRAIENIFEKEYIELVTDKRVWRDNSVFLYRYFNLLSFPKELIKMYGLIKKNLKTIKVISQDYNIKLYLLIFNLLESVFLINCVEHFFKTHNKINKILLNSDVHKIARIVVSMAKKSNITSFVQQHGSTVLEYGYLPVRADYFLAWGELSKKWFIERETNSNKLIITGTPKTDFINQYNIDKTTIKNKIREVLLILNPIGETNLREFIEIIKGANVHVNYNLNVKLHPGSIDNRDLIEEYFDNKDINIYKEKNIHDLIFNNDVIITTTSTVGNEAVAFYKPLVKIEINNINTILEYDVYNCSHSINSSESLSSILKKPIRLHSKIINYEKFIESYFYKLDGNSAKRIKKCLL